ncbi:MAG TPA: M56 family metallopeptidase, partial [Gemmatales bacterium]|nr:M56 family metallopeptidase [Gemmatales bacterium]
MTTFMEVGRLGELALQSTLWLALGLGLASCVRGPIRLRKRLLTGTLLGLVLLTALCLVPVPAWRLADLWPATATADSSTSRVQVFTGSAPAAAELDLLPWLLRLLRNSKEPATPTGRVDAVSAPAGGHDLVRLGPRLAVWGAGALTGFFLLRLLAGLWALRRFRAQSRPIGDVAMLTLMADLASALGVKRRPTLAEHPHLAAPATLGWRRPLILLPPSWRSWSDVERRCVLAHELAHVAAGDFALSWWAQFVRALYAWQPFAHSITRSLLDQMELLADQAAANAVGGMDAYARALCRLALRPTRPVPQPPALAFWPASLSLSWRMTMLKQGKCERVPGWPLRLTLASLLTLGLAITTGLRGPVAAQEPPSAPEPRYAGAAAGSTGSPGAPVQVVRRSEPYDLRFVQSDAVGVWACRPVVALALPSVEPYLPALRVELTQAMLKQALGREMPSLDLASVEQAVGSLHFQPKTKEQRGTVHASLEMVRLVPGASWRTIFAQDCPDLQSEETAGRLFARLPMIPALDLPAPAIGLVDDRTLVIGDERRVKLILEGKLEEFKPVWSAATWDRLQNCWVAVGVDMNKARELVDRAGDGVQREMLKPYAAVWEKADCLLAGVLPLEPVGLRIISAAKANEQLTIDATFIDALKRACQDVVQETIGVQESKDPTGGRVAGSGQVRLEDLAGFRPSGAAGAGTGPGTGDADEYGYDDAYPYP